MFSLEKTKNSTCANRRQGKFFFFFLFLYLVSNLFGADFPDLHVFALLSEQIQ